MVNDIIELITSKQYSKLKGILADMEPVDIAQLFEDLPERYMPLLYRLLSKESAAEVFVELDSDTQEMLIRGFSDTELKAVLDELYLDDAVDIIEEMPSNVVKRIIKHSAPEMRNSINEILKYCLKKSNVTICTNGTLINEKKIKVLKEIERSEQNNILFKRG